MELTLTKQDFFKQFKNRAIVVTDLPTGSSRNLAAQVNKTEGRGDATLRTRAEYAALFDLLDEEVDTQPGDGSLTLRGQVGNATEVGNLIETYLTASKGKDDVFDQPMYMVSIEDWPKEHLTPEDPVYSNGRASLAAWKTDPALVRHIPPPSEQGVLLATKNFSLKNSGNRTLRAPKRSWKINFKVDGGDDRVVGMWRLNLKAMYNDPSQMREALAWKFFGNIGIPASQHTFAKLAINGRYNGLFSLIEQVDKSFLKDHFGNNDEGNLYKAYCGNVGCATLTHKTGADGDDSGFQYYLDREHPDLTYRLKTNEDDAKANTYDDLAQFIRTLNGIGLTGGKGRFNSDGYKDAMEDVFNVTAFLRWASTNLLIGSWDNYFATPANYYLYNSGKKGAAKGFIEAPYFTWIPWDYDNSFGIDYFNTRWQYTDIIDWAANTKNYHDGRGLSKIPLVQNLLKNEDFKRYYLDHLEYLLDTIFYPDAVGALIGEEGAGGLWDRTRQAAYLESDTPHGRPFTGRQFTNHQVYKSGLRQDDVVGGNYKVEGILHFVRMRYDSAREQLARLRKRYPRGASGEIFSGMMETLPEPA
jgi:hypothetical protein